MKNFKCGKIQLCQVSNDQLMAHAPFSRSIKNQKGLQRIECIIILGIAGICASVFLPNLQVILNFMDEGMSLKEAFFLFTSRMSYARLGFITLAGLLTVSPVFFILFELYDILSYWYRKIKPPPLIENMNLNKIFPLEEERLSDISRNLTANLFDRLPDLRFSASMVAEQNDEKFDLVIDLASPTGDDKRKLRIWVDETGEPSIGFGDWHTHENVLTADSQIRNNNSDLIDLIEAIITDNFVLIQDIGGKHDGFLGVLDLKSEGAIEEELTSKYSPGRIRIISWSGNGDRELSIENWNET